MFNTKYYTNAVRNYYHNIYDQSILLTSNFGNLVFNQIIRLLIPLIQLSLLLFITCIISFVIMVYFKRKAIPVSIIQQPVYFNHFENPSVANIQLLSSLKQWTFLKNNLISEKQVDRYFSVQQGYDIYGIFNIAKSPSNYAIGTMAVKALLIDSTGEVIAKSIRPIVIPYQSALSLWLESIVMFPLRMLGPLPISEVVSVTINLLDNYIEPIHSLPATGSIELVLSTPVMDITSAYLTILPKLSGLTYYFHHYPITTFVLGFFILSGIQILFYGSIIIILLIINYVSQLLTNDESEMDDRSRNNINQYQQQSQIYNNIRDTMNSNNEIQYQINNNYEITNRLYHNQSVDNNENKQDDFVADRLNVSDIFTDNNLEIFNTDEDSLINDNNIENNIDANSSNNNFDNNSDNNTHQLRRRYRGKDKIINNNGTSTPSSVGFDIDESDENTKSYIYKYM